MRRGFKVRDLPTRERELVRCENATDVAGLVRDDRNDDFPDDRVAVSKEPLISTAGLGA